MRRRTPDEQQDTFEQVAGTSGPGLQPTARWIWNDRLDVHEIRRQVRLFAAAGYGAFLIEPGPGLRTPFLSDGWLDGVETAIDEARRMSVRIWLHDGGLEHPSPGQARWRNPEFQRKTIRYEIVDPREDGVFVPQERTVAAFSGEPRGGLWRDLQRIHLPAAGSPEDGTASGVAAPLANPDPDAPLPGQSPRDMQQETGVVPDPDAPPLATASGKEVQGRSDAESAAGEGSDAKGRLATLPAHTSDSMPAAVPVPDGHSLLHIFWEPSGDLDPLDPSAVRAYLDSAYELCYREFGAEFSRTIAGMATELPSLALPAWSPALQYLSAEILGREVIELLPSVLLGLPGGERDRYDYSRLVQQALIRSYAEPLRNWCSNRDIQLVLTSPGATPAANERRQSAVIPVLAAAPVPAYAAADAGPAALAAARVATAAAHDGDPGRPDHRALCWLTPAEGHENQTTATWRLAAAHVASGADMLGIGPFLYSIRGDRKRQWPVHLPLPDDRWQGPRHFNLALGRLLAAVTSGHAAYELLVIYPASSLSFTTSPVDSGSGAIGVQSLQDLNQELLKTGRTFNYVDETTLAQHAVVQGDQLRVGAIPYRAIIVPDLTSISSSTLELLYNFIDSGGVVALAGRVPTHVDGVPSERAAEALSGAASVGVDGSTLQGIVARAPFRLCVENGGSDVLYTRHVDAGRHQFVLLVNGSRTEPAVRRLSLKGLGRVDSWDLETGRRTPAPLQPEGETMSGTVTTPAGGVVLLSLDTALAPTVDKARADRTETLPAGGPWSLDLDGQNYVEMSYAGAKIGAGDWSSPEPLSAVRTRLLEMPGAAIHLRFQVELEPGTPRKGLALVVESPERWHVTVNGISLPPKDTGWWRDVAMRRFDVSRLMGEGPNVILLSRRPPGPVQDGAVPRVSLESIYLLGRFVAAGPGIGPQGKTPDRAVDQSTSVFRVRAVPNRVDSAALGGLFSGTVRLQSVVLLPRLENARISAEVCPLLTPAAIIWNGRPAGMVAVPPFRADVSRQARAGKNRIQVVFNAGELRVASERDRVELDSPGPLSETGARAAGVLLVTMLKSGEAP